MKEIIENGFRKEIKGVISLYYDGYWIKYYDPPIENLSAKKRLIQSLTRRLFNHMEHGINIPGKKLDEVRAAYEAENDPKKKRVKGAMLAGTLFNRAADIFTHLVELEDCGIKITPDNDLMHTCGLCLREALEFGKMVKHPCVSTCSHTVLVWDNIYFRVNHAGYTNAKTTIRFK